MWKWTKPPRWPTKMADSCPTPTPTANPFRDTPFMCTVVCWQSPTSPTPPPILLCSSLRVQLRAKTKTKYQSFSLHSYEQVNMNTSAVTTLYLPAEFAWAPMGRKPQEKYKYIDASWPSTRYSSMPYYPSSLPSIDQPYTSSPPSQPMPCLHASYLFRLLPTMLPPPQFQKNAPNYSAAPV